MSKARLHRTAPVAGVALLLSLILASCNPGGGPGGGSEEASAQTATLLVGGPGGGSSGRDVDPSVPDGGLVPIFRDLCPRKVGPWDEALAQGDFQAVVQETEPEIDADDPALRTQALLYNSLGRLYTSADPLEVLESLDAVRQAETQITICGDKGGALLAEGSMFAHAALGEFQAAEQELAAVAAIAPAAGDDLRGQLEDLQTVDETTTTAPAPSPTPSPVPTPTPSPSESL
jgi:hypothetical protein